MGLNRARKDLYPCNRVKIIKHSNSSFIGKEAIFVGQDKKYCYISFDMGFYFDRQKRLPKEVIRVAPDCIEEI